jgi:hypothetical protein
VDSRGIAVIDAVVILEIEGQGSAIVGAHGQGLRADPFDGAEGAVLDAKPAFVLQERDTVPAGEVAFAPLDRHTHLNSQITSGAHAPARCLIEGADFVVGVSENDPAALRRFLPVAVPAVDQIGARLLA